MTDNFVTLFDKNYLYKGLALYQSMRRHIKSFRLWILCLDGVTFEILSKIKLSGVELLELSDIETTELKKAKSERTLQEYYWTLSSSLILYVLENNDWLDHIGYIDADLFFYSGVEPIFKEWGDDSILIMPHGFPPYFQFKEKEVGKFIVSMVLFKNNTNAKACLRWWKKKTIDWCYYKSEDGRLGDQVYLEEFANLFKGVHVLNHKGAILAPWNIMYYPLKGKKTILIGNEPLIFYHFHGFKLLGGDKYELTFGYELSPARRRLIYDPYLKAIKKSEAMVNNVSPEFKVDYSPQRSFWEKVTNHFYTAKLKCQRIFKL